MILLRNIMYAATAASLLAIAGLIGFTVLMVFGEGTGDGMADGLAIFYALIAIIFVAPVAFVTGLCAVIIHLTHRPESKEGP